MTGSYCHDRSIEEIREGDLSKSVAFFIERHLLNYEQIISSLEEVKSGKVPFDSKDCMRKILHILVRPIEVSIN